MAQQIFSNTQKIAMLMVSLGAERAAQILDQLDPEQTARIVQEIAAMGKVSNQSKRAVLREMRSIINTEQHRQASFNFAEEVLDKTLGQGQARQLLQSVRPDAGSVGPNYLSTITPERAAVLLNNEPPHIVSMLLIALPVEDAAMILDRLSPEAQERVAAQLGHTTPPSPDVRLYLEKALRAKANRLRREEQSDGRVVLSDILRETEKQQSIAHKLPDEPLQSEVTSTPSIDESEYFESLGAFPSNILQEVFRQSETTDICHALGCIDQALRDQFLAAIPFGRRVMIQKRLRTQPPLSLREISEAQDRIMGTARMNGKLIKSRRKNEALHV